MRDGDARCRFPAWMRLRVGVLLAGVVYCALVLALVAQHRRHRAQEAGWAAQYAQNRKIWEELTDDLTKAEMAYLGHAKMGFGQATRAILEAPTKIERLEVVLLQGSEPAMKQVRRLTGDETTVYAVRPTGEELDEELATRLAAILLDTKHYLYKGKPVTVLDAPEPQFGFRLKRGEGMLDLLFSLEGNSESYPHVDLFLQTWTDNGKLVEQNGRICMFSKGIGEVLAKYLD